MAAYGILAGIAQATQVMLQCQEHTSTKPVPCRLNVNLQFRLSGRGLVHTVVHSVTAFNALRCRAISQLFGMPPYSDPGCILFIINVLDLEASDLGHHDRCGEELRGISGASSKYSPHVWT